MTGPIIDRDAIIEKAARVAWDTGSPLSLKRWDELSEDVRAHSVEREYAADMLPSIADDLLAPIEALMVGRDDWVHPIVHLSELRQAVAAIREAVRA